MRKTRKTLIKNGFIASVDPSIGNIPDGDILIEGQEILQVASNIEASDAEVIDATSFIVMPGFIDAHRHLWQGAVRGYCADWSLDDYVSGIRMNAAAQFTADDMYAAQLAGAHEALNAGVTTVTDYCHNLLTPDHAHESIRALQESGLRVIWNYGFNYPPEANPYFTSLEQRVALARDLAKTYFSSNDGLVTLGIAPEEFYFLSGDEAAHTQFDLAREFGANIFWHCNSRLHARGFRAPREVASAQRLGLLGPDLVLVHMGGSDEEEWQMVADSGASVAFTPDTELQMGMGWASGDIAERYGVNQAYGTDITSNNSADMFTALRLALQTTRCRELERTDVDNILRGVPVSCVTALKWGTVNGAGALGLSNVGSLTPGKQADIIFLKGNSLSMCGWDRQNVAGAIILQAQSVDVDTVMVGGKVVKRHGRMLADIDRTCRLVEEASQGIAERVAKAGELVISDDELNRRVKSVQMA